jgi:hypothetical protein
VNLLINHASLLFVSLIWKKSQNKAGSYDSREQKQRLHGKEAIDLLPNNINLNDDPKALEDS